MTIGINTIGILGEIESLDYLDPQIYIEAFGYLGDLSAYILNGSQLPPEEIPSAGTIAWQGLNWSGFRPKTYNELSGVSAWLTPNLKPKEIEQLQTYKTYLKLLGYTIPAIQHLAPIYHTMGKWKGINHAMNRATSIGGSPDMIPLNFIEIIRQSKR